jgi:hypothetical protein
MVTESESGVIEAVNQDVSQPLVRWNFGEGREDVFVQSRTDSPKVLIVGRSIPWWGMVVAHLDLRIHSILLSDKRFFTVVHKYFGTGIPMGARASTNRALIHLTCDSGCLGIVSFPGVGDFT